MLANFVIENIDNWKTEGARQSNSCQKRTSRARRGATDTETSYRSAGMARFSTW
jgi:hypothetical protein